MYSLSNSSGTSPCVTSAPTNTVSDRLVSPFFRNILISAPSTDDFTWLSCMDKDMRTRRLTSPLLAEK